jgi:prolyl-tRNA synthetase
LFPSRGYHRNIKNNSTYRGLKATGEQLYQILSENGIEASYDDREETPGVKVKDTDLIGIPLKLTLGKKNLKKRVGGDQKEENR